MTPTEAVEPLGKEWDVGNGFFYLLRRGIFDEEGYLRTLGILKSIKINKKETQIDREFVSLVWFIPLFVSWQRERVCENNEDLESKFSDCENTLEGIIEDLLGVP